MTIRDAMCMVMANERLRCSIHGNQLGCPGPFQCSGWVFESSGAVADAPAATAEDTREALAIMADARLVFGKDYQAWRTRIATAAAEARAHEAELAQTPNPPTSGAV